MAILLGDYEKQILHRYIEMDAAYGAQCWDLFAHFCKWLGVPVINTHGGAWSGWAIAIWDQFAVNGASKHWIQVPASAKMEQGDVPIWKVTPGLYPGSHIAIGIEDAGSHIWCFSQNSAPSWANNPYPNWSTAPVIKQLLPKTGLAGYLRRKPVASPVKTVAQLADEVLAGKHGNGAARVKSLGGNYAAVQKEIERRYKAKAKPKPPSIAQLARDVLAGKYGVGEARKRRLGSNYVKVQAEVERQLFNRLVTDTLNGKYGVGTERQRRLGASYAKVQAEINRRFG